MKAWIRLFVLLWILLMCAACAKAEAYTDSISCKDLMKTAEQVIPTELGYADFETEQIRYDFYETTAYDDASLRYSTRSENINEIGIFHSESREDSEEIRQVIERYLRQLREEQSAFIASYAPHELPKLEEAEIRQFGNYTVYAILSSEDRAAFFAAIQNQLNPS